jgi:group II intron reverse transcriptase/maturase
VNELKSPDKPFEISKWAVQEAWEKVKANKGAPGVDGVSIEGFEADLHNNLYKVWNRMSSGSYFPPPVRAVEIPKPHGGGTRMLGVPTIADRVAQTVVAEELGARVEAIFHEDSYGYRPGRSALDAVGACRQRCWKADWVIDLDIQKFFDSVSWELMLKAVGVNTDLPWVPDELREYPDKKTRDALYAVYKDIMINQDTAWIEISGPDDGRTAMAIEKIDKLFN